MEQQLEQQKPEYLKCERKWVYLTLMFVGGYLGAFTFSLRGGVFCNAQTANVVLFSLALGQGRWGKALYYLIPMSAYLLGAFISELLPNRLKKYNFLRWDTVLMLIEAMVLLLLGFIPEAWPFQISQVAVNFICSMQYNTFRQAEHIPMATTFCTNHIRQTGVYLSKWIRHKTNREYRNRVFLHLGMLFSFAVGCTLSTVLCGAVGSKAVWGAALLLLVIFCDLAHADLTTEKELLAQKPAGH